MAIATGMYESALSVSRSPVMLASATRGRAVGLDTVFVVALLGFIATGVLARYLERRGDS